jgi:hypothetical protein
MLLGLMLAGRCQHHGDALSFEPGGLVYLGYIGKGLLDFFKNRHAFIRVGKLPAPETERELHPVAAFKELAGLVDFDAEVVCVNFRRANTNFLQSGFMPVSFGFLLLFIERILVLAKVHDSANGRLGHRGDFHEIVTCLKCHANGIAGFNDPNLFVILIYQPYGRDPDPMVRSKVLRDSCSP